MAIITRYILGERCPTKEAVKLLELGGVLECIPHEVDPDARLTNAAIAMRRSEWWWDVPPCNQVRGERRYDDDWIQASNEFSGEIPWR